MAVLVKVEAKVKPDRVDDLIALLKSGFPDTRKYDGCQNLTAYLGEDGLSLIVIEHWDTKESYEKYLAWRTQTGVMDLLATHFAAPPSINFYHAVDA